MAKKKRQGTETSSEAAAQETKAKVYPSWRYHRKQKAVIVKDAKEDAELGEGWADSPAAFLKD